MKKFIFLFTLVFISLNYIGQNNYRITFDKLSNKVQYFKSIWVNGELKEAPVKSIRLQQNDIVQIEINNVNPFTFSTEVYMGTTEVSSNNSSPIGTIIAGFSGFGGPALSILTSLASNPPDQIFATRGEQGPIQLQRETLSNSIQHNYENLISMLALYQLYNQQVKVKYSKILSQDQIIDRLDSLNQILDFSELQVKYDQVLSEQEKIANLKESLSIPEDDDIWSDLKFIEDKFAAFQHVYLDEEGNLKSIDLNSDLFDVETEDFTVRHTFSAEGSSSYGNFATNDFFMVFSEIKGEDSEFYPIDFVKKISIPIQQPKEPYWILSAQNFYPIGGVSNYDIKVVYSDYFEGDSIQIQQINQSGGLFSLGTMLGYDFETVNALIPSVIFGAAITGVNKSQDNWALSLALGGGLSFRKFPYLSLNGGIGMTQTKVLKNDYYTNRPFLAPENANDYNGYETIFRNKFKPSFFFGIGLRL
jgi:hypothetical protein